MVAPAKRPGPLWRCGLGKDAKTHPSAHQNVCTKRINPPASFVQNGQIGGLCGAFKALQHVFAIAVRAFDKTGVFGNVQPDPRMPQRAFAPVAGHARGFHNLGFGRFDRHG